VGEISDLFPEFSLERFGVGKSDLPAIPPPGEYPTVPSDYNFSTQHIELRALLYNLNYMTGPD